MQQVNLSAIDLNLLNLVATVLEERSATRAAWRLHVTQSAVSNGLKRAREVFGDALVMREPHGLRPTPRGAELLPLLKAWLEEARRLVANAPLFDAATTTRTFTIACTDAVTIALLRPLTRLLNRHAPGARLRVLTLDRLFADDGLARGDVDLLIGIPPVLPPGHDAELVYRDPLESIVRQGHPRAGGRMSRAAWAALPHVELALFGTTDDAIDRALGAHGLSRTVKVALPHFAAIPLAVVESDGVATVSARLAKAFAQQFALRRFRPPVSLAPLEVRQVWHRRAAEDAGVLFLRQLVLRAAKSS